MARDPLANASWEVCATRPGEFTAPGDLDRVAARWHPAPVPGTAGGALRRSGIHSLGELARRMDERDWWFRCGFSCADPGPWVLELCGLATIADVWLNDELVSHSENMFEAGVAAVGDLPHENQVAIRFLALGPLLDQRRPRSRWRTLMASHQNLRWFRTTLLGRQPGWTVTPPPVGPWRPVRLLRDDEPRIASSQFTASCDGDGGSLWVRLEIRGVHDAPSSACLLVGDASSALSIEPLSTAEGDRDVSADPGRFVVEGEVVLENVERWWPHTHGPQALVAASLEMDGQTLELGRVGFRSVEVDRSDGGFKLLVNGVPVFCRGAGWFPVDPVNLAASDGELRATLELVRAANMNMVRVPGGTVYEDERFWDLCDELGILVWQDCMLGYLDPPDDETFTRSVETELAHELGRISRHPALAVVCGGQEIEEQAAFFGLPREAWSFPLTHEVIPQLVAHVVPGVPYVTSSPTGGAQPSQLDSGVSHYFGIGSYLRDLSDARDCGIRFASESLAFAVPPEPETVEESFGGASHAGHDPRWKEALHHDTGRSWDTEDFRDFYVGKLFGVDPHLLRYEDPERALDMGRAAIAEIARHVLTEWRRPDSSCDGALLVAFRDLAPGAGWGIIDALGRPKSPWFALRRTFAPLALLLTDEGLNGLRIHLLNEGSCAFAGVVRVQLYAHGEVRGERALREVALDPRSAQIVEMAEMFDGFRDLSHAYRFGPPAYDVIEVSLVDSLGVVVSEAVHLPGGLRRPLEPDLGLKATAHRADDGRWELTVSTRRFAQWVAIEMPGFRPEDSWFHLPPGSSRTLALVRTTGHATPRGHVRALNSAKRAPVMVED